MVSSQSFVGNKVNMSYPMELNKEPLYFLVSSSNPKTINKCSFCGLFSARCVFVFVCIFVLLLITSLFEIALKHNAEELSIAPKKKAAMCFLCTK